MPEVCEFDFVSEMPQKKTRVGLLGQIKEFFNETEGGAIPIPMAAKMTNKDRNTIDRWVKKGKLRGFKVGSQVLVNIHDLERLIDEPVDIGGRPRKAS